MNFHFRKATRVFLQTWPWVLVRLGVGIALGVFTLIYFGAVILGVSRLMGSFSGLIGIGALVLASLLFLGVLRFIRRYILYLVTAGHVAVIAHAVEKGEAPSNQVSFGKDKVAENFKEASALFIVDRAIKSVINQFNSVVFTLTSFLRLVPALKQIVTVLKQAVRLAASYLDEAVLAHMFLNNQKGSWTGARDGLVLYAKVWKPVLTTSIIVVVALLMLIIGLLLALAPLAGYFGTLTPGAEILGWAVVVAVVATLYLGILGPWVKTLIITTFIEESRNETPDSETMDWMVDKVSNFKDVVTKAEDEQGSNRPSV